MAADSSRLDRRDTYCVLPSIHVCQTIDGRLKPCCRFQMRSSDPTRPHLSNMSLGTALRSDYFVQIREQMSNGERVEGCKRCYVDEDAGIESYRQIANKRYRPEPEPEPRLTYVELAFSNECNLKCRMCQPTESRKWNDDWFELFPDRRDEIRKLEWNLSSSIAEFRDIRYLKIVGGEPFLSGQHRQFLLALSETVDLGQVEIDYHTNCTFFPKPEIIERIVRLKRANIRLSIDATGDLAEYIRHGVKWPVIDRVARRWVELSRSYTNVEITVFPTFQVYNAHALLELLEWSAAIGIAEMGYSFVCEPSYLAVETLPREYRERLAGIYAAASLVDLPRAYHDAVQYLRKRLESHSSAPLEQWREFANFDRALSLRRRQDLEAVAPELAAQIAEERIALC